MERINIATRPLTLRGVKGSALLEFISKNADLAVGQVEVCKTTEQFNLSKGHPARFNTLINLARINDIKSLNKFFRAANESLSTEGVFIGCVETLEQRQERLFKKFPPGINYLYYSFDFMFKRVFPKFKYSRKLYFFISNGRNRALSISETLGRLVYNGFRILDTCDLNGKMYFAAAKETAPREEPSPSTGLLLKINRVGYHGEEITVYKFRTMHPYAQYLQAYVYEQNKLAPGGKIKDDFRITKWGRWMRRCWIDEIPMIWNILRGDLKIIGVRPLSEHYLSLYTPEHRAQRIQGKPGLIPPFYADLPTTLPEIMESEARYIQAYLQAPFRTDLHYGKLVFQNIFLKGARSH